MDHAERVMSVITILKLSIESAGLTKLNNDCVVPIFPCMVDRSLVKCTVYRTMSLLWSVQDGLA